MSGLSKKFKTAAVGLICLAGMAACSKPPAPKAQATNQPAPVAATSARAVSDDAVAPKDSALKGYFLVYDEVDRRADLAYDRNLQADDGQPVSSLVVSLPPKIDNAPHDGQDAMMNRNKLILDFMAQCIGPDNAATIAGLAEGQIMVYTTPLKMRNTLEITHVTPGHKGFVTDAVLGCRDTDSAANIDQAVAKLKADALKYRN